MSDEIEKKARDVIAKWLALIDGNIGLSKQDLAKLDFCIEQALTLKIVSDEYNKGYADAMVRKASCCETNEMLVKMMAEALEFGAMFTEHAIALDYLGEGSTKGMAEDYIKKAQEALAEYRGVI